MDMNAVCTWKGGMSFEAANRQHLTPMDAKPQFGKDKSPTPKELLLDAICGCTAMDVISLLRKFKEEPATFTISAHADVATGHPAVFTRVQLVYKLEGTISESNLVDAVHKSMSQYCSVSAMVSKAVPIVYEIHLNGAKIADGEAQFP